MRMVRQVPQMERWPGPEQCRRRGRGAGAEDGEPWRGRVSVHAAEGRTVWVWMTGAGWGSSRLSWVVLLS
jgi:hypothetical protein